MALVGPEVEGFCFFIEAEKPGGVFPDADNELRIRGAEVVIVPPPAVLHAQHVPGHKNSPAGKEAKIPAAPFYGETPLSGFFFKAGRA
jgi:hypothetical protein